MERAASVHAPVVNRSAGARGVGQPKRRDGPQAQQVESQSELRPQMQLPQHQPQAVQLREQPAPGGDTDSVAPTPRPIRQSFPRRRGSAR